MIPRSQIARVPIAFTDCLEQVILAALHNDDGIGTRAVRNAFVVLLEIVLVVDVYRVRIRSLTRRLRRSVRGSNRDENTGDYASSHAFARLNARSHPFVILLRAAVFMAGLKRLSTCHCRAMSA